MPVSQGACDSSEDSGEDPLNVPNTPRAEFDELAHATQMKGNSNLDPAFAADDRLNGIDSQNRETNANSNSS